MTEAGAGTCRFLEQQRSEPLDGFACVVGVGVDVVVVAAAAVAVAADTLRNCLIYGKNVLKFK